MPDDNKKSKCLRVGVTGGIGSGKSTVCRMFEVLGIPVYDADDRARGLIVEDPAIRAGIVALFGPDAYLPDGSYNRSLVAGIVFHQKEKLAELNALVHPAVEKDSSRWHAEQEAKGVPYTIKEAALMVESGSHKHLDRLIVVTAPEALRIRRVMDRDGLPEAAVSARLRNQLPEAEKVKLADYEIVNDGQTPLVPQVWNVHRALLEQVASD